MKKKITITDLPKTEPANDCKHQNQEDNNGKIKCLDCNQPLN